MWLCETCKSAIDDNQIRCVLCGRFQDLKENEIQFCMKCGSKLAIDKYSNKYCSECGNKGPTKTTLPISIIKFTADKTVIETNEPVTLSWVVENAKTVLIKPLMREVKKNGSLQVTPKKITEYTLVAANEKYQDESTLIVGVKELPKIDLKLDDLLSHLNIPSFSTDIPNILQSNEEISDLTQWLFSNKNKKQERLSIEKLIKKWDSLKEIIQRVKK